MIGTTPLQQATISANEREFIIVWSTLTSLLAEIANPAPRLRMQSAADTLLELLRESDCIDPSVRLDGTFSVGAVLGT